MNTPLNILIVSFDWRNYAEKDPAFFLAKLERDHLESSTNTILIWSWGPGRFDKQLTDRVRVVRRPANLRFFRPLYDILTAFLVPSFLAKDSFVPDLVLVYDMPFALALKGFIQKHSIPLVLTLINLPTTYISARRSSLSFLKLWYQRHIERNVVSCISGVYTINEATKAYARSLGIQEERIVIFISNTIARDKKLIEAAKPGMLRTRYSIPKNQPILFSVGRLEGEKGFDLLIKAFSDFSDTSMRLVIAGQGPLEADLRAQVRARGVEDRVVFCGVLSREELWSACKDADVFILFSRAEALGLVFWEAMYAGLPVLGSYASGIVETIGQNQERGFLWREEDGVETLEANVHAAIARTPEVLEKINKGKLYVLDKLKDSTNIHTMYNKITSI